MIDFILGVIIFCVGVLWLVYTIKNLEDWNEPMGWTVNFKGFMGSVMTMFLGGMFIFGYVKLSLFW